MVAPWTTKKHWEIHMLELAVSHVGENDHIWKRKLQCSKMPWKRKCNCHRTCIKGLFQSL